MTNPGGPLSLKARRKLIPIRERRCEKCNGTGIMREKQPRDPTRRICGERCPAFDGKGRLPAHGGAGASQ